MGVRINDRAKQFIIENAAGMDRSLNRMAIDIERLSKQQVPHKKGQLEASGGHRRVSPLHYVVEYNKEYAEYQHRGQRRDGTRVVRKYSKPGKKKEFLSDPGDTIADKAVSYFKQEGTTIRV